MTTPWAQLLSSLFDQVRLHQIGVLHPISPIRQWLYDEGLHCIVEILPHAHIVPLTAVARVDESQHHVSFHCFHLTLNKWLFLTLLTVVVRNTKQWVNECKYAVVRKRFNPKNMQLTSAKSSILPKSTEKSTLHISKIGFVLPAATVPKSPQWIFRDYQSIIFTASVSEYKFKMEFVGHRHRITQCQGAPHTIVINVGEHQQEHPDCKKFSD